MKNLKTDKGITLIALVITIIVLLILAGVSIATLTGDNGILTKAKEAKELNAQKTAEEQVKLAIMESYGQDGKVDLNELKENLNKIPGITEISEEITFPFEVMVNGQKVELKTEEGTITVEVKVGTTPSTSLYQVYNIGDEVTVGGEFFYVLEESDENTPTVTLLSKYNLNKEGTEQSDATYSETASTFSSTNYWASVEEITYPYDLNNVETDVSTDAINKAKSYAISKGATNGRLLTYEEYTSLEDNYSPMIYGTYATDTYLSYWSSRACTYSAILFVDGGNGCTNSTFFSADMCGVRPVIEISKSSIS